MSRRPARPDRSPLSGDILSRMLEDPDLAVNVTDPEGTILRVSPRLIELTGYDERELIGANPRLLKSDHTPRATHRNLWSKLRTHGWWRGAILNRRKSGLVFLDRETIVRAHWPRPDQPCYVAVHRDASVDHDLRISLGRAADEADAAHREVEAAIGKAKSFVEFSPKQAEDLAFSFMAAMEARDPNTAGHARRTSILMDIVGARLNLFTRYQQDVIRLGAILHDIGKIGIPDRVLLKPRRLTPLEFETIQTHAEVGFEILRHATQHEETLRIVRHHHERLDGSGYPDGLVGDEIPDYVRAFAVCDCFDAMTSKRTYRPAMSPEHAIGVLWEEVLAGKMDYAAVRVLKRLVYSGALADVLSLRQVA